jgi:hypothetical protein
MFWVLGHHNEKVHVLRIQTKKKSTPTGVSLSVGSDMRKDIEG